MTLPRKAIEAGVVAVQRHHAWSSFWSFNDAKQLVETGITAALGAEGFVLAPKEPTQEMVDAANYADTQYFIRKTVSDPPAAPVSDIYRAMLSAYGGEDE